MSVLLCSLKESDSDQEQQEAEEAVRLSFALSRPALLALSQLEDNHPRAG